MYSLNKNVLGTVCDEGKGLVRLFSQLVIENDDASLNVQIRDLFSTCGNILS
jgi:hypothetical protein